MFYYKRRKFPAAKKNTILFRKREKKIILFSLLTKIHRQMRLFKPPYTFRLHDRNHGEVRDQQTLSYGNYTRMLQSLWQPFLPLLEISYNYSKCLRSHRKIWRTALHSTCLSFGKTNNLCLFVFLFGLGSILPQKPNHHKRNKVLSLKAIKVKIHSRHFLIDLIKARPMVNQDFCLFFFFYFAFRFL